MYYKGTFRPKNPKKYAGNPTNITYRSLWELRVMKYLDLEEDVVRWSSEEIIVPYVSPIDGKWHRYFVDFYVESRDKNGKIQSYLWEVKPHAQTIEPTIKKRGTKPTKKYLTEVQRWGINEAKWEYAHAYCKKRGWSFHVLTEKDLFGKSPK